MEIWNICAINYSAQGIYTLRIPSRRGSNPRSCNQIIALRIHCFLENSEFSSLLLMVFLILSFHVKKSSVFACLLCWNLHHHPITEGTLNSVVRSWPFDQSSGEISITNWCFHWNLNPYTQDLSLPQPRSSSKASPKDKWPPEAHRRQNERSPVPSPTFIRLEEAMKASSNHSTKLGNGEGKSKSTPDHSQDRHRGCLQEASTPDPLTKSTPKWQIEGKLHSTEAPDQWDLQHHQKPAMG